MPIAFVFVLTNLRSRDWQKLIFYYYADHYLNFKGLVNNLSKVRLWMSAVNPASFSTNAINRWWASALVLSSRTPSLARMLTTRTLWLTAPSLRTRFGTTPTTRTTRPSWAGVPSCSARTNQGASGVLCTSAPVREAHGDGKRPAVLSLPTIVVPIKSSAVADVL